VRFVTSRRTSLRLRRLRSAGVCCLALALLEAAALAQTGPGAPGANPALEGVPEKTVAELMERRFVVLPDTGDGLVRALVLFQHPRDSVFSLLTQPERQAEFRSELGELILVETKADGWIEEQRMRILFVPIRYRLRWKYDGAARTIAWQLDPDFDNSIEHVSGTWEFLEFDGGRTLARFGTRVRVGAALPTFVQDQATRSNVPETLESTVKWVDSSGEWRP